ncbi:hypothetical protein V1506DRAFT_509858 [Lipomyces tetrasporus]
MTLSPPLRLLIINPNTSKSITESLKPHLAHLDLPNTILTYWTCPTGTSILKAQADNIYSALHSLLPLLSISHLYDGFLIACYADHMLTPLLQSFLGSKPVTGIFEASVSTALRLLAPGYQFGILTTGKPYEAMLAEGIKRLLSERRWILCWGRGDRCWIG